MAGTDVPASIAKSIYKEHDSYMESMPFLEPHLTPIHNRFALSRQSEPEIFRWLQSTARRH